MIPIAILAPVVLAYAAAPMPGQQDRSRQACSQPASRAADASDTLTVVTFNTYSCRQGLRGVVDVLRNEEADIICLQEVLRGDAREDDQALSIASALGGLNVVSARTLGLPSGVNCDQAILSPFKLTGGLAHSLDAGGWVYAVQASVERPGSTLHVFSVHTHSTFRLRAKHIIKSSTTRLGQVSKLLEIVRKLEGDVIVAGDFNAAPWMPEYYGLTQVLRDFGTVNAQPKPTYPSYRPRVRIDYVFGRGALTPLSYRVLDTRRSDHLPVVATLKFRPSQERGQQNIDRGIGEERGTQPTPAASQPNK